MAILNLLKNRLTLAVVVTSLSVSVLADNNFIAKYGTSPTPFKIDVRPSFINKTVQKVALTRYTVDVEEPDFTSGPPRHNVTTVRDYWLDNYDWYRVQDQLNQRYRHFTTSVLTGSRSNFTNPVPLHFVHHRSNRTDAIPLLFIHGWPGSFLEVDNILDGLLNPSNSSAPAFHVVAPSIPGFGFSPAPRKPGWGARETGYAFYALMEQLGYSHYVIQGGDFGGVILRYMAGDNPSTVLSVLDNMWLVPPNATDLQRYSLGLTSADENTTIEIINTYDSELSGYRLIQETKPLQVAIGMTDSPVGFAMWIYNLMFNAVDRYVWTPEEIITWSMMYYIQGPYGGMRFYKEVLREGGFSGFGLGDAYPYVHQPVAISEFPKDIWYGTVSPLFGPFISEQILIPDFRFPKPLDWARRRGNVVVRNVHSTGGHFAALESPELLLGDIRAFWGNSSLSNVGMFRS